MLVRAAAIVWQAPCVRAVHTASVQRARYDSILDTIGSTPVVRINNIVSSRHASFSLTRDVVAHEGLHGTHATRNGC